MYKAKTTSSSRDVRCIVQSKSWQEVGRTPSQCVVPCFIRCTEITLESTRLRLLGSTKTLGADYTGFLFAGRDVWSGSGRRRCSPAQQPLDAEVGPCWRSFSGRWGSGFQLTGIQNIRDESAHGRVANGRTEKHGHQRIGRD